MIKIRYIFLILLMLCLFACSTEEQTGYDGRIFDISEKGDMTLTATTTKVGANFILTIKGEGNPSSYSKKELVPWNAIGKKITKVNIEDGITKISSFMFYSVNVEEIFLPQSVNIIEENAFKENMIIYSYGNEVTSHVKNNIYYYSEQKPTKAGNYFHLVDGLSYIWKNYSFLFIGNSFTYCPGYGTESNAYIPNLFKNICADLGVDVEVDFVTKGSHTLTKFGQSSDEMGKIVDQKLNENQYDFIILQEHSTTPINYYSTFNEAVGVLVDKINKTQENAKIRLYETWGFPGDSNRDVLAMSKQLQTAYLNCTKEYNLEVNKVGQGFAYVYENHQNISLYTADNKHPSDAGSYLSALIHVASILGLDIRNTNYLGGLSNDVATTLKSVAYKIVFE